MNKLDLEETTRRFHNVYEQVAKEYGYKTREDTKELDFNSPNGMTMLKTVEMITTPYLEEIERLNNIINELEKFTNERIQKCYDEGCYIEEFNIYCEYDSNIKELKGSNNEKDK